MERASATECVSDQPHRMHRTAWSSAVMRRSSSSGITYLPPELLAHVFQYLIDEESPGMRDLVFATHVCTQWRDVALDNSSLWAFIPFSNRKQDVTIALTRSKNAPLVICATWARDYSDDGLFPVISANIHRIRRLHFRAALSRKLLVWLKGLKAAPILEELIICRQGHRREEEWAHFLLPECSFMRHAPRLRHLNISLHCATWNSPMFHGLTWLAVSQPAWDSRPSVVEFLRALRGMPNLEHLHLVDVFPKFLPAPSTNSPSDSPEGMAILPRLKAIGLECDSILTCTTLLRYILCPALESLTINATVQEDAPNLPLAIKAAAALASSLKAIPWAVRSLNVQAPEEQTFELRAEGIEQGHNRNLHIVLYYFDYTPGLPSFVGWNGRTGCLAKLFFEALELNHLHTIDVGPGIDLERAEWHATIGLVPSLTSVQLYKKAWSLFDALFAPTGRNYPAGHFPQLQQVEIKSMCIFDAIQLDTYRVYPVDAISAFRRANKGVKVILTECDLMQSPLVGS